MMFILDWLHRLTDRLIPTLDEVRLDPEDCPGCDLHCSTDTRNMSESHGSPRSTTVWLDPEDVPGNDCSWHPGRDETEVRERDYQAWEDDSRRMREHLRKHHTRRGESTRVRVPEDPSTYPQTGGLDDKPGGTVRVHSTPPTFDRPMWCVEPKVQLTVRRCHDFVWAWSCDTCDRWIDFSHKPNERPTTWHCTNGCTWHPCSLLAGCDGVVRTDCNGRWTHAIPRFVHGGWDEQGYYRVSNPLIGECVPDRASPRRNGTDPNPCEVTS